MPDTWCPVSSDFCTGLLALVVVWPELAVLLLMPPELEAEPEGV